MKCHFFYLENKFGIFFSRCFSRLKIHFVNIIKYDGKYLGLRVYIIERPLNEEKKPIDILPDFMCFVYKYLLVRHSKDIPSSNSFFFSIHWRILKIFSRSIAAVLTFKLKFPSHIPGIYSFSLE